MAYSVVPVSNVGDKWDEDDFNNYLQANFAANSPDIYTTKGDLAYATAADTLARLAVGTNGQMLGVTAGAPAWISGKVPSGMIIIWSGATGAIPTGWVICDGNNSTPDLRNSFVVGAGSTYAVDATGGAASANLQHAHTTDETVTAADASPHTHTQGNTGNDIGAHTHVASITTGACADNATANAQTRTVAAGSHTHALSSPMSATDYHTHSNPNTAAATAHTHGVGNTANGLSTTQSILPAYYALAFIMKT